MSNKQKDKFLSIKAYLQLARNNTQYISPLSESIDNRETFLLQHKKNLKFQENKPKKGTR